MAEQEPTEENPEPGEVITGGGTDDGTIEEHEEPEDTGEVLDPDAGDPRWSEGDPDPEPEPDPVDHHQEDTVPETTSDLLKIQRALTGCDAWAERLTIAFIMQGKPDTSMNRMKATAACVAGISCDIYGTVTVEGVTDEALLAAVAALPDEASTTWEG